MPLLCRSDLKLSTLGDCEPESETCLRGAGVVCGVLSDNGLECVMGGVEWIVFSFDELFPGMLPSVSSGE